PAHMHYVAAGGGLVEFGGRRSAVGCLRESDVPGRLLSVGRSVIRRVEPDEIHAAAAAGGNPGEEVRSFIAIGQCGCGPGSAFIAGVGEPRVEDLRATQVIGKSGVNVAADAGDSGIVHRESGEDVVGVGGGGAVEDFVVI